MDTPSAGRTRTYTWDDPMASARAAMTMDGLGFLGEMAAGRIPPPPIAATLDFEGFEVAEGAATFFATPAEWQYNPIGVVHGGYAATLLDSAMGCAVHSMLPAGTGYTTVELKVNMVRPITTATGRLTCEARVVHMGRRLATAEGRLLDEDGRLYAHGSTTCMVLAGEGSPS